MVCLDSFLAVRCAQQLQKVAHELAREVGDVAGGTLADNEHLAHMRLGLNMTLETVLVATLFLTYLTVPSQALQTFRFLLVGDSFGGSCFGSRHRRCRR
jgi:hypothetical protein